MQNLWWAIAVVVLVGCAGGATAQGPGPLTDAAIDDASNLEEAGSADDSTAPQPEDGGMATVLDSPAVEWSDDAGYVNPGG